MLQVEGGRASWGLMIRSSSEIAIFIQSILDIDIHPNPAQSKTSIRPLQQTHFRSRQHDLVPSSTPTYAAKQSTSGCKFLAGLPEFGTFAAVCVIKTAVDRIGATHCEQDPMNARVGISVIRNEINNTALHNRKLFYNFACAGRIFSDVVRSRRAGESMGICSPRWHPLHSTVYQEVDWEDCWAGQSDM